MDIGLEINIQGTGIYQTMVDNNAYNKLNEHIINRHLKVIFLDLLCTAPSYDMVLLKHLLKQNSLTLMAITSNRRDKIYFTRNGLKNGAKIIDVVARLRFRSERARILCKTFEYILNLLGLLARFSISRPDIVHVQWMPRILCARFEIWFMKAVRSLGLKQVYTLHNILPHDTGRKYVKTFSEVYELMDGIICHTNESRQQLVDEFGIEAGRIRVVQLGPNVHGATDGRSAEAARTELGISDDAVAVLAFGNVKPYKGTEFLLKSWPAVVRANAKAILIIAGNCEAGYREDLQKLIDSEGIRDSVQAHFRFLTDEELCAFHQASDILVYLYESITQSGALLTGMTFGKPIVATSLPGFRETIDDGRTGFLVDYGDADGLSAVLGRLIQSPSERDRLGANVLADVNRKFSWDSTARETLDFYQEILGTSPGK